MRIAVVSEEQIRDLGWPGVVGNTDEMLLRPESLTEFASQSPQMQALLAPIEEMAAATCEALGDERIAWLSGLPRVQIQGPMALVHASPLSTWRSPGHTASDTELESAYGPLGSYERLSRALFDTPREVGKRCQCSYCSSHHVVRLTRRGGIARSVLEIPERPQQKPQAPQPA